MATTGHVHAEVARPIAEHVIHPVVVIVAPTVVTPRTTPGESGSGDTQEGDNGGSSSKLFHVIFSLVSFYGQQGRRLSVAARRPWGDRILEYSDVVNHHLAPPGRVLIHDQPGHQVLDEGVGGMGFRELFQVMEVFELQHGFSPPAISPGNKKPAEAGYEGVWGFIKNLLEDSL